MPSRLFVGNLPYEVTEDEIREHFSQVAPVGRVFVPLDRDTGKPRGFAFVEFADQEHALSAIQQLHQKPFKNRPLVVNEARPSGGARPPRTHSPSFAPQSRERTTLGGSFGGSPDESSPSRPAPPRTRRRPGSRRSSWDEPPKKEPIPEKRRGQIFGGYDDLEEDDDDTDFENFATGLSDADDQD
jgi:RNA recognition motif-containing protein